MSLWGCVFEMKKDKKEKLDKKGFWRDFWRLLRPFQGWIHSLMAATVVFELARLVGPYLLKLVIDTLTGFNAADLRLLVYLLAAMLLAELFLEAMDYMRDRKIFRLLFHMEAYYHKLCQNKLLELPLSYHEKENTGNKIIKIEKGIGKIFDLLANMSYEVVPTLIQIVLTLGALIWTNWMFALSFVLFSPIFLLLTYFTNKSLYPVRKTRYKNYEKASGMLGQAIMNINTVKSFVQERREMREYKKVWHGIRDSGVKEWFKLVNMNVWRAVTVIAGRVVILALGAYLIYQGKITIGTLVFVYTLTEKAYHSMWRLSRFYDRVEEGAVAVERLINLSEQKSELLNKEKAIKPAKINGLVELDKVDFTYSDADYKALDNVSIRINSGCVTALAGPSGGGKTTVARLIYRHYDPQAGSVRIDGVDLRDYDIYSFRKHIAIVPQEVEIFNGSIRDNIAYADPNASREKIRAAARIANAEEFILNLKDKYDTEVGERGIKLSGGQRQRIGIARAILANPRILIFDEATSSLDSQSEKLIQEAMDKITQGRTTIVIAHRLSTIKKADKIIVLEKGRVVEQGSHYELSRQKGGLYAKLLNLQELGDID